MKSMPRPAADAIRKNGTVHEVKLTSISDYQQSIVADPIEPATRCRPARAGTSRYSAPRRRAFIMGAVALAQGPCPLTIALRRTQGSP